MDMVEIVYNKEKRVPFYGTLASAMRVVNDFYVNNPESQVESIECQVNGKTFCRRVRNELNK